MKTKKLLSYLLAGLLAGCVPVMSLYPLYNEKDVVFDEKLLGTWVEEPNNGDTVWEFTRPDANKNAYRLIFSDKEGRKGSFIVHLVKLKDKLFLDVYPANPPYEFPSEQEDPNKINWPYNGFLMIHGHTFIKMNSIEPQLKLQFTDDGELKKLLKEDSSAVEHTLIEDKPVLTASTRELQAFILKYADDSRVFSNDAILTRKKIKDHNENQK